MIISTSRDSASDIDNASLINVCIIIIITSARDVIFSPVSVCMLVCLTVCYQDYSKLKNY